MKLKLHISADGRSEIIETEAGPSLLAILRDHGYSIYAPCGGKGKCGKCLVSVSGEGIVRSCSYFPVKDLSATLSQSTESTILVSQTEYLEDFPFETGTNITSQPYGIAIDLGTTTVVMYFLDLNTGRVVKTSPFLNPQSIFGADVITRIEHCQKSADGLKDLQVSLVSEINRALKEFAAETGSATDNIERIVFAGNTTMLHILLGEDPVPIALAPFTPKFTGLQIRKGQQTLLSVNTEAEIITLPCISAYVGADIVAGLAALIVSEGTYLYIDIGTNGEMALVKGDQILTCATAAGPAFEGTNISCGMGAVPGAISAFKGSGYYEVIGKKEPSGICGSGIIDIVAYLLINGLIDETGFLKETFVIHPENGIRILQQDIREIQLAKSAIYSGMLILLRQAGLTFNDIDALYLAGGFGNFIDAGSALRIGLLPGELKDRIHPVGNSAGIGALQFLKSHHFREKTEKIIKNARHVELSAYEDFATEFALNMNFTNAG